MLLIVVGIVSCVGVGVVGVVVGDVASSCGYFGGDMALLLLMWLLLLLIAFSCGSCRSWLLYTVAVVAATVAVVATFCGC